MVVKIRPGTERILFATGRNYLRARLRAESYPEGALFKGYTGKGYHDTGVVDGDSERQHRRMYSGNDRKTCSTSAGSRGNQDDRDRFDRRRVKMVFPAQAAASDNLERCVTVRCARPTQRVALAASRPPPMIALSGDPRRRMCQLLMSSFDGERMRLYRQ